MFGSGKSTKYTKEMHYPLLALCLWSVISVNLNVLVVAQEEDGTEVKTENSFVSDSVDDDASTFLDGNVSFRPNSIEGLGEVDSAKFQSVNSFSADNFADDTSTSLDDNNDSLSSNAIDGLSDAVRDVDSAKIQSVNNSLSDSTSTSLDDNDSLRPNAIDGLSDVDSAKFHSVNRSLSHNFGDDKSTFLYGRNVSLRSTIGGLGETRKRLTEMENRLKFMAGRVQLLTDNVSYCKMFLNANNLKNTATSIWNMDIPQMMRGRLEPIFQKIYALEFQIDNSRLIWDRMLNPNNAWDQITPANQDASKNGGQLSYNVPILNPNNAWDQITPPNQGASKNSGQLSYNVPPVSMPNHSG